MPINVIIFSKDRPAQLDLLLRSMKLNWSLAMFNITIIYRHTNKLACEGYIKVLSANSAPVWIGQDGSLLDALKAGCIFRHPHTMFLVDDDVIVGAFPIGVHFDRFEVELDCLCLSLRLHPKITYDYVRDDKVDYPGKPTWKWRLHNPPFGYPWSLDGHIYRTPLVLDRLSKVSSLTPNRLEGDLGAYKVAESLMAASPWPVVVGIPWNKVQTELPNKSEGPSANEMNEKFLSGYRLSYHAVKNAKHNSVHIIAPVEWENE